MASLSPDQLQPQLVLTRAELQDMANSRDSQERRLAARETQTQLLTTRLDEISQRIAEIDEPRLSIDRDATPNMAEALQWAEASEYTKSAAECGSASGNGR